MRCLSHPNSHIRIPFQNWANLTQFAPYASHLSQYQHALLEPYQPTHTHPHDHVYPPPHPHTHTLTNTPTQPHSSHINHLFGPYYHTSSSPHPVTPTYTHTLHTTLPRLPPSNVPDPTSHLLPYYPTHNHTHTRPYQPTIIHHTPLPLTRLDRATFIHNHPSAPAPPGIPLSFLVGLVVTNLDWYL